MNKAGRLLHKRAAGILKGVRAAALCLAVTAAVDASAQYGKTSYDFLRIPTSAHAFALGGTAPAIIDDDLTLTDQNPGLLGPEVEKQASFNYMLYMNTGNFAGVRFGMGAGEHSAWAAGIRYLNQGKMKQYDQNGVEGGDFTPSDIVIEGTYSRDITDRWRGGANLKMIYSHYDIYTALAIAADIGVNYYDDEHDLSFSFVLKNMGGQVKRFDKAYNRVPFDIEAGYMQGFGSFSIAVTATNLTKWRLPYYTHNKDNGGQIELKSNFGSNLFRHLIFGIQYNPSENFWAALSYNYKTSSDMGTFHRSILSGFNIGLGFKVKGLSAGIAYGQPHKSANTLALNLAYTFGELMY